MIVRKRRKLINGFNITLLEKVVDAFEGSFVQSADNTVIGKRFIRSENSGPYSGSDSLSTDTLTLSGVNDTQIQYLTVPLTEPQDAYQLAWNAASATTVWVQPVNYQPQLDSLSLSIATSSSNISELQTLVSQFNSFISSDYIETSSLHIPFAVAWSGNNWGGPGKAGIFWHDPGTDPYDGFAIKYGCDNASIGETGYSYGSVGVLAASPVVMRFTNGMEGTRGFIWAAHGYGRTVPVMALDTDDPLSNPYAGSLKVKGNITAERGDIWVVSGGVSAAKNVVAGERLYVGWPSQSVLGPIEVANYDPSTGNCLITMRGNFLYDSGGTPTGTSLNASHNNYVLSYTHLFSNYGAIGLRPAPAGGGSGTLPGVEIDCGSFTADTADINCGSFV